jgi:hypothetical protein
VVPIDVPIIWPSSKIGAAAASASDARVLRRVLDPREFAGVLKLAVVVFSQLGGRVAHAQRPGARRTAIARERVPRICRQLRQRGGGPGRADAWLTRWRCHPWVDTASVRAVKGERLVRSAAYLRRRWPVGLAVCAIFKDEARYLPEWVEFHRVQGVERFYLYENNSTDGWEDALEPYRDVVELHRLRHHPGQFSAYADCLKRHRWDTRWIAFIDLDEFLFSPTGQSLPDVLGGFGRVPGVVANWRVYGPNGHDTPPDGSVIENYPIAEPDTHPFNRHIKSIAFPAMTSTQVQNPHNLLHYGLAVGEDHRPLNSPFRDPPTVRLLRVNHYLTRSRQEWEGKIRRARADTGEFRPGDLFRFEQGQVGR